MKVLFVLLAALCGCFHPARGQEIPQNVVPEWKTGEEIHFKLERKWTSITDAGIASTSIIKTRLTVTVVQKASSGWLLEMKYHGLEEGSLTSGTPELPGNLRHLPVLYNTRIRYWADVTGRFLALDDLTGLYKSLNAAADSLLHVTGPHAPDSPLLEARALLQDVDLLELLMVENVRTLHNVFTLNLPAKGDTLTQVHLYNRLGGDAYPAQNILQTKWLVAPSGERQLFISQIAEVNQAEVNRIYKQSCANLAAQRGETATNLRNREHYPGGSEMLVDPVTGWPITCNWWQECWLENELVRVEVGMRLEGRD